MSHNQDIPPNASAVIANKFLDSVAKQLPSSQEKRGDQKLDSAREIAEEFESVITQRDRNIIEEKITLARETKVGLDSKSGVSKFLHAREYRRAARDAYRFAKHVSDRGRDGAVFSQPSNTLVPPDEDNSDHAVRVARHLYRCHLSCHDAFPSPYLKDEWIVVVWSDACARIGGCASSSPLAEEFVITSITLLADMKMTVKHLVESLYGFDTSRAPDSISRNAGLAQALLTNMAFIYREPNFGATPHHPYRHPIIQKAINMLWFHSNDGDGIVFHEFFTPIPIPTIALILTVIECCISEWTDGTHKSSNWNEDRYKTAYHSHVESLSDLRDHDPPHSGEFTAQIQHDLLKDARIHAGAPFDPVTGSGRLQPGALHAAVREDLPRYPGLDNGGPNPTIDVFLDG